MSDKKINSLREHVQSIQDQHPGEMLLFEMGDFYEVLGDQASAAASVLGLTVTYRGKNTDDPVPMCGFVKWNLDKYAEELKDAGLSVSTVTRKNDRYIVEPFHH